MASPFHNARGWRRNDVPSWHVSGTKALSIFREVADDQADRPPAATRKGRGVAATRISRSGIRCLGRLAALAVLLPLIALLAPAAGAYPLDSNWAPPATVFIPETGQTIDRAFLDLWRASGGAFAFGNPITPEIAEDEQIVQYYEYARFEYWPEGNEAGEYVALGAIGSELAPPPLLRRPGAERGRAATAATEARAWRPRSETEAAALAEAEPSYRFVPETEHGVWGGFRAFWEATGEAAYLGNPVSEEYLRDGVSYQVFERGMLRWREGEAVAMVPVGDLLVERYGLSTRPQRQGRIPVYDEALFVPPVAVPDPGAPPALPPGGRAIVVSLSQQGMWAFDGNEVVRNQLRQHRDREVQDAAGSLRREHQDRQADDGRGARRGVLQCAGRPLRDVLHRPRPRHPRRLLARQLREPR